MDSFRAQKHDSVIAGLQEMKTDVHFCPPGTASCFQPLDVAINAAFKSRMQEEWKRWLSEGEHLFTPAGNRKRPSWQHMVDFVSNAVGSLDTQRFRRAFECSGMSELGRSIDEQLLNERLRKVLLTSEGTEPMDRDDDEPEDEEAVEIFQLNDLGIEEEEEIDSESSSSEDD